MPGLHALVLVILDLLTRVLVIYMLACVLANAYADLPLRFAVNLNSRFAFSTLTLLFCISL